MWSTEDGTCPEGTTVLVVEDEPGVLEVVSQFLRLRGFCVLEARNGVEALSLVEEFSDPIHLVLTDVQMPGMNGRDLAENLRLQRPSIKVLFMSGYTGSERLLQNVRDAEMPHLLKPFTSIELIDKIREQFAPPARVKDGPQE